MNNNNKKIQWKRDGQMEEERPNQKKPFREITMA